MDRKKRILLTELKRITDPLNVNIIELSVSGAKDGLNIKVVVDKEGGISLNDCERITRLYNDRLAILEPIEDRNYTLQVSSPGIDRVFKDPSEYNLFKSRNVKVILKEPLDKESKNNIIKGRLEGMKDDLVALDVDGMKIRVPLNKISKTKLDG